MIMKYVDPTIFGPSMCLKETRQIYYAELLENTRKINECMFLKKKYKSKNTAFT